MRRLYDFDDKTQCLDTGRYDVEEQGWQIPLRFSVGQNLAGRLSNWGGPASTWNMCSCCVLGSAHAPDVVVEALVTWKSHMKTPSASKT